MKKFEIELALDEVGSAKRQWAKAQTKFNSDISAVMTRLLHEAAHNYMSAEDVARHTGFTVKRVRQMMRDAGLNPRDGKNMLSKIAADALANNAALMGIEPHEMDLTSPLAYLPMGEEMKRELRAKAVAQVHEVEHRCSSLDILEDEDGVLWYQCPECENAVTVEALNRFGAGL